MLAGIALMPHGDDVLEPKEKETKKLTTLLKGIGEAFRDFDAYVIVTPHNVRMSRCIGIITAEHLVSWLGFGGIELQEEYETDRELALKIHESAENAGIPVVDINFGALSGEYSRFPLGWGETIPLHFLERKPLVVITSTRGFPRARLIKFGEILAEVLERQNRKIGLIISADHGHAHDPKGPYGYTPESKEYDEIVMRMLKEDKLEEILDFDEEFIERAKPDSYWQLLIMVGALRKVPMRLVETAYACPSYFGMAGALYLRKDSQSKIAEKSV